MHVFVDKCLYLLPQITQDAVDYTQIEEGKMRMYWVSALDLKETPTDSRDVAMVSLDEAQMEIEAIRKPYEELKAAIKENCADFVQTED